MSAVLSIVLTFPNHHQLSPLPELVPYLLSSTLNTIPTLFALINLFLQHIFSLQKVFLYDLLFLLHRNVCILLSQLVFESLKSRKVFC